MSTHGTVLKQFQKDAVDSACAVLEECLSLIHRSLGTPLEEQNRQTAVATYGSVLFEAPTGIGKTLMAGATVERLSVKQHKIIWFWFAPFSGVIDQTINVLHAEHSGLRPRIPKTGRSAQDLRSGDVFVTTWAALAVSNASSRLARQGTETELSIDDLVQYAKASDFSIGVVIDEAHHSFRGKSQAYSFYRDVIAPDVTILATATPRDKDIDQFVKENRIKNLNRVSVSRAQGVEAGLLKRGVKVGVFKADDGFENFVDMQLAALRYGVATHRRIKQQHSDAGIVLTPLLLVQADSSPNSIENVQKWLKAEGFSKRQVRVHTSKEPDPHLLAIAADEEVEVLIFKMAVALGFDAPRAQTLVSMRNTVDPDFGIQIVGRIMRVHRAVQAQPRVPTALQYGYVFISNRAGQQGLSEAAKRINSIRDELAEVADSVFIVEIGGEGLSVQYSQDDGQTTFFPLTDSTPQGVEDVTRSANTPYVIPQQPDLLDLEIDQALGLLGVDGETFKPMTAPVDTTGNVTEIPDTHRCVYMLRDDIEYPRRFFKAVTRPGDEERIISEVVQNLDLSNIYAKSLRDNVSVSVRTTEIFEGTVEDPERFRVMLSDANLARTAQYSLNLADRDGYLDPRKFKHALEHALDAQYVANNLSQAGKPVEIKKGVNRLLALYPEHFKRAVKRAINQHTVAQEADDLPERIETDFALSPSRLNIYKVYPSDMNSWEMLFAEKMDDDNTGTVKWWHRNPVHKGYSVFIPVPGYNNYYPDFVVGVNDREIGDGVLLVETKNFYNDDLSIAKTQVDHPIYSRPMMLFRKDGRDWHTVEYDSGKAKNILDKLFSFEMMKDYPPSAQ